MATGPKKSEKTKPGKQPTASADGDWVYYQCGLKVQVVKFSPVDVAVGMGRSLGNGEDRESALKQLAEECEAFAESRVEHMVKVMDNAQGKM